MAQPSSRSAGMKAALCALLAGAAFNLVEACADGHQDHDDHGHQSHLNPNVRRASPSSPSQLPAPTRPLEWGDVNIIHTTDSHGWLLGHQKASEPEPNYSGDLGEFASFVAHMKEIAERKGVDLLLVDSGDLHDGTGLTDGFPAGGVDGHDALQYFAQLPYDLLAIGNHELYVYNDTLDVHRNLVPKFNGRYLSSNVNITVPDAAGNLVSVPVGNRYVKFTTAKGRKVTSLGVLFDFTGNDDNTTVQKVEDMVKEAWLAEAIQEEPDFFLLTGHMPVSNDKWPLVFNAIRAVHPQTPILILGGHTHIRDCVQLDGRSMALESGRYMETVGWMSANLDEKNSTGNITFTRRYLDPNRVTYEYHTSQSNRTFDTRFGQGITQGLEEIAQRYDLSSVFGTAPQDYTLTRNPYPSNGSLLSLMGEQALPIALATNNSRASIPNLIIANSGVLRFDIYKGVFDRNDQYTVATHPNAFVYVANVTADVAKRTLATLTQEGELRKRGGGAVDSEREAYARGEVETRYRRWLADMAARETLARRDAANLTLGYVTNDSCPGVGDDTPHLALPHFDTPDFFGSSPPNVADDAPIDLVFTDFEQGQVLDVLNALQSERVFTAADVASYSPILIDAVVGVFAKEAWN